MDETDDGERGAVRQGRWRTTGVRGFLWTLMFVAVWAGVLVGGLRAEAQAKPTAVRELQPTVFAGVSGVYTGIDSGRNLGVTVGADLGFRPMLNLLPAVEVRGTYPVKGGAVDSQRNILAGLRVAKRFGRAMPYGDFLFGRGQIDYGAGRVSADQQLLYVQTVSNVFSPGVGVDLGLSEHFGLKLDGQIQHYETPVTLSGHTWAKALTVGAVYRFSFDRRRR